MRYSGLMGLLLAGGFLSVETARAAEGLHAEKLPGIVVDDAFADFTGDWKSSTTVAPFVGKGYVHAQGQSNATARFEFDIPSSGSYLVLVAYTAHGNRAAKVPVIIHSADGEKMVYVNQQHAPSGPLCFHLLGEFRFDEGKGAVVISTEGTQGAVIVDAVQILTDEQLAAFKLEAETLTGSKTNVAKTVAKSAATPIKVATGDKKSEDVPPSEAPPVFSKSAPAKAYAKLTPAALDALLKSHLGDAAESTPIDDALFLRRVSLDVIGRQPTVDELSQFVAETDSSKRAQAIERLLASPEYGANWANYWSDVISYRTPQPELTFLNYQPFKK